ncbi:DNA ligase 1-like [Zophobas morio]|uniref:DNA ligase 1-like n=1 Tax=Zophobas morio TaxID=2755281 RepID=UPI003082F0FA
MQLFVGLSVLVIICVTFAQDLSQQEEKVQEERDLRDYNQDWRAVDYSPPHQGISGWVPQPDVQEQPIKRRRIRKRKRRPPVLPVQDAEESSPPRRKVRPQRLDQIKEPWEEMGDEIAQKSNSRRRLIPVYDEEEVKTYERVRDPFTALQEAEEKQKTKVEDSTKTPDLKTLLKQSGGLSLSEVLQQKNLTLSELLKGNRQAISVLARETETTTEIVTSTKGFKHRRLPPSIGLKKDINRNFVRTSDNLSSYEVIEAQRKRLALLHSHKDTKMFPDVVQFDVVTEATTEKRVFVPSSPKSSNLVSTEQIITIPTTTRTTTTTTTATTTTTSTTTQAPLTSPKSRQRGLPMTSAKLNKVVKDTPKLPSQAIPINLNDIFGLSSISEKNETEISDGPLKMIIDLTEIATTELPSESENTITTATPVLILEELPKTTTASVGLKLKRVTAKEEIMEILKNPFERENLSKILSTRNMTVEELVQLRERGSSQLHLADIFHNKTLEPEPKDEPFIGHIQGDVLDDHPFINRKAKTMPISPEVTPITQSSLKIEKELTTKLPYTITSFPTYKIETNKDANIQPFFPIWQQLYPHFFEDAYENNNLQDTPGFVQPITTTTEKMSFEELERLEEIENALAEAANEQLKVDLPQNVYSDDEEEFINLPSGVKSAILASLAIIGLSLLVFLTILLIFKWSHKKKARLNYNGSFLGSKIRSPILEPNQKRTFRTFVSETLGRKKNYYKTHMQSMSDSIWDNEEKKSYMI